MEEIHFVEVYGIKIDSRCAALLEIVMKFGSSGYSHQERQADEALEKLGKLGCTKALQHVVMKFSSSGYSHQEKLASRALELI